MVIRPCYVVQIWSVEVKEQGVRSLWALAGDHISGQRFIAERVGPGLLIELIMTKSAVLQAIGCSAIAALCREVKLKQNLIMREGGVQPLVRLLRQASSSHSVLTTAVQTVGVLCVGIAHCNNRELQTQLAGEDALHTLVQLYQMHETDLPLKVAVGHTLASLILSHKENEARLDRIFDFTDLLTLVDDIDDKVLLLHCLTSLAVFGFNNTGKQFRLREKGGLQFDVFQPFLESDDAVENCQAAFNMVVLARDIVTHDQVTITARAVRIMVSNLQSPENHVVILTASLIASLCHTRAGIPDAFVSLGVVPLLLGLLHSQNTEVRASVAVALGYLSFNGTAARTMLKECRIEFELFGLLRAEIAQMDSRICSEFVQAYLKTERVGLPYKFLECNGGHPILPSPERFRIKSSVARPVSHSDSSSSPRQQQLTKPRPKTAGGLSSGPSHKR